MNKLTARLIAATVVLSTVFGMTSCRGVTIETIIETDVNIKILTVGDHTEVTTVPEETTMESTKETTMATTTETTAGTLNETEQSETAETEETEETFSEENEYESMSPQWVTDLPQANDENIRQLVIVAGYGMDSTSAAVTMHQRNSDGNWVQILSTPGNVGWNGLCYDEDRYEGCGQTPIGVYHFTCAFGIAENPGCSMPYIQVDDDMYWSGDMREGMHYNEMVDINDYPDLDTSNSEHLIDYDSAYQYCLNISFNEDGTPGRGSAIFLHCPGQNSYTLGCVAVPEYIMVQILQCVEPDCVIIIDTVDNLNAAF